MFFFKNKSKKNNNSKLKILSGYNYRYRKIGKESEKTIHENGTFFLYFLRPPGAENPNGGSNRTPPKKKNQS